MFNQSSDPLAAALELAGRGVPVFPCDPTVQPDGKISKAPLTEHGHKDATTDPTTIRQWWSRRPDALVGVPTGRITGLAVFDVDRDGTKGIDGFESIKQAGLEVPRTRAHLTPRGGMQCIYRLEPDESCPSDTGVIGKGLDRRGDGGYVIWWPAHGGTVLEQEEAAPAPSWLVNPWRSGKDSIRPITPEQAAEIRDALIEMAAEAGDGEHNSTLSSAAFQCGQLVEAGFFNAEDMLRDLVRAAQNYPETSKTRRDAELVVAKGLKRGMTHPGFEDMHAAVWRAFGQKINLTGGGLLIDGCDAMDQPAPAVWLIRGIMEDGISGSIWGHPNAGKSFVTLDWALSVACGIPWQGHETKRGPVVYICGEGQRGFRRRIAAWITKNGVSPARGMFRWTRRAVALNDGAERLALYETIDGGPPPILVIIDTRTRATPGWNENDVVDSGKYAALVGEIMQRYGCAVVSVLHCAKSGESAAGHHSFLGTVDNEWSVKGVGVGPPFERCALTVTKLKDGSGAKPIVFKFVDVALPWFDERGEQQVSAVLEPAPADEGDPAAVFGDATPRQLGRYEKTPTDELFWSLLGDDPTDYDSLWTAWTTTYNPGMAAEKKQAAFNRMLAKGMDRQWFKREGDGPFVPNAAAIERDRAAPYKQNKRKTPK